MSKSQNTKNEQQKDLCITSEQLIEQWKKGELPEGASCYEDDMEKEVACCICGKKFKFGDMFTSRHVHTKNGFGYAECEGCYYGKHEVKND